MKATKERLAKGPVGQKLTKTWASLPGRRVAYAVQGGRLYIDGAPGPAGSGARNLSFSADGRHHAYYLKRGTEEILVVDGRELGAYTRFGEDAPVWQGERIACTARRGNTWWVLVDGEPRFEPSTELRSGWGGEHCSQLAWSKDGLAYAVIRGKKMYFELEGVRLGEGFKHVYGLVFGGEAGSHAYYASGDEDYWLVWNGKVLGPFGTCERPRFAQDGSLWFVAGGRDRMTGSSYDSRLYVDGKVVATHQLVRQMVLARDVPKCALIVTDAMFGRGKFRFVHGHRADKEYDNLLDLSITPDGAHTSAVGYDNAGYHNWDTNLYDMLRDGVVVARAPWIDLWTTALSDDGKHVAFVASESPHEPRRCSRVHIDRTVESVPIDTLHSELLFAPDGKSLSFIAERRRVMSLYVLPVG